MLISMPHGTSTIFGAFQAILALLANGTNFRPHRLKYRVMKSSPVNSLALELPRVLLRRSMLPIVREWADQSKGRSRALFPFLSGNDVEDTWPSDVTEINNL
jgi:hypothetical protein